MHARFLLLCILAPLIGISQEGNFEWQNPLPQGNDLNAVSCASGKFAWAVGDAGTIMKSEDKGVTWEILAPGITIQLNAVSFIDSLLGWVGGNQVILFTEDGGEKWEMQELPDVGIINDIQFLDSQTGWAVSSDGKIISTKTGGNTWSVVFDNPGHILTSIHFPDPLNGYVVGWNGEFLLTSDGGQNWTDLHIFDDYHHFHSVFFTGPGTGFLTGFYYAFIFADPLLLRTTDNGQTWQYTSIDTFDPDPYEIVFINPLQGYISADNCSVYETWDGGEHWHYKSWGEDATLYGLSFFDDGHAISTGTSGHILRKLGGPFYIWKLNESGTTMDIKDIVFTDEMNGWAVGIVNTFLFTNNGGVDWNPIIFNDGEYHSWQSLSFPDYQQGWAAGISGQILHTEDGGQTWNSQDSHTNNTITSIFFTDASHGWAVGEDDLRLRTTDGGDSWFGGPSFMWDYSYDVFFTDSLTGWVVGSNGFINKSINGGANWVMQYPPTNEDLLSVFFTDIQQGWVVGNNSTLLHTTDGGFTWLFVDNNANADLEDIFFLNAQEGWITGSNGTIMNTIDGGQNWEYKLQITDNSLAAVYFTDYNSGWICGEYGTILTFKPGITVRAPVDLIPPTNPVIEIFPNPCHVNANVHLNMENSERLEVLDLEGKLIKSINIYNKGSSFCDLQLNLGELKPGIYLIKAISNKQSVAKKIIIN